jgi:hypothetical protein
MLSVLGTIISEDAAVGPATEIETNSVFDKYLPASARRNFAHSVLYTTSHGNGN